MLRFVVRIVFAMAGLIAGWFVARDATNFGIVQMAVSLLLITLFVAAAAFWPSLLDRLRSGRGQAGGTKA